MFKEVVEHIIKENQKLIIVSAVVDSVNQNSLNCSREGMADLLEVRLNSVLTEVENSFLIVPKVGSVVLLGIIENNTAEAVLLKCSEVERIKGTIETTKFELDNTGYKIERAGENLKSVINDFMSEVNKIVVVQGNTINVAAVTEIQLRLNKILK